MVRGNHQEIYDWGWIHDQDNKKVVRKDGVKDETIVEEKGKEYYTKVEDGKCIVAQNYWKEYAPLWSSVRQAWDDELAKKKDLNVMPNVEDIYLYKDLMKLTPKQTKEAKELVNKYIVNK